MKKLISACLALVMLLGMVTLSVSAATPEWTGRYSGVSDDYRNGYVGEIYAMTTFTKTNGIESVEGVDYKASSSNPFNGDGSFTMVVGDWGCYTITAPYTGVYAMQLQTLWIGGDSTATVRITTDEGYMAQFNLTSTSWSSACNQDQPIYLREGENNIKLELLGNNNAIISALDLGRLDHKGAASSLDFLPLVKIVDESIVVPMPTATPVYPLPTATPSPWTGKFGDLESHKNGYVGEIYAMTTFTKTNGIESVEGVDYKASDRAPFNGGQFTMVVGDWGKYEITVPYTGVYAMQLQSLWIGGNGTTTLKVSTEDGYYTEQTLTQTGWTSRSLADQPLYLKEGKNVITVELLGPNNCIFAGIDLGRLDARGASASLDYLPLVKLDEDWSPTPIPTPPAFIAEWTGNVRDQEEFNGYVGEKYAMTTFTKTNGIESVEGVDYKATSTSAFSSDGAFTMVVGDWGKYEVSVPYAGVYAMQIRTDWMSNSPVTFQVTTEDGYAALFNLSDVGWSNGVYNYQDQPLYLKEGTNIITIKLTGRNNCILSAIDFGRLDAYGAEKSLDYLPLVKVTADFAFDTYSIGVVANQDELTFFGKVGAEYLGEKYGVEVNGKKFYGAKDGDVVSDGADGTTTFTFGEWDGSFDIILQNITEKGTAGEKTYRFFVGDYYTDEAVVTVE